MSRIRHATEAFVNNLIDSLRTLIQSNTNQINVLQTKDSELEDATLGNGWGSTMVSRHNTGDDLYNLPNKTYSLWGTFDNTPRSTTNDNTIWQITQFAEKDNGYKWLIGRRRDSYENKLYYNTKTANQWNGWQQLATTTKTDILPTANTGYTMIDNNSYIINNIVYLNFIIQIPNALVNTRYIVATVPSNFKPPYKTALNCFRADLMFGGYSAISNTGQVVIETGRGVEMNQFIVSGVYVL